MSTYYPYMCKYIAILNNYKNGTLILSDHKVFEYIAALKLRMIMWEDVHNIPEARLNIQYFKYDSGIDAMSYDLTRAAQIKYVDHLTWGKLSTFANYCSHLQDVVKLIVVIRDDTTISDRVCCICKIIRIDISEEMDNLPLEAPMIIINEHLKYSYLSIEERINELFTFGNKPKLINKFSDGQSMCSFWNSIKYGRRLNNPTYNKLRESTIFMKHYGKETENDVIIQIAKLKKYFIDYTDITGVIDYRMCDKFILWRQCKLTSQCETYPWNKLLRLKVFRKNYSKHLKVTNRDKYYALKTVTRIHKFIKKDKFQLDDDFWLNCINNHLCDTWPYNELLKYYHLRTVYYLNTVNFPLSTYDDIMSSCEELDYSEIFETPKNEHI